MSIMLKEILEERNPWLFGQRASVPDFKRLIFYKLREEMKDRKITVLYGVRQTGKTTALLQLANEACEDMKVFYIPVDSITEVVEGNAISQAVRVVERYYLGRKLHEASKVILMLDETHYDPNWSLQVKALYDRIAQWGADVKLIATGSSSVRLSSGISENLTGRVTRVFVNPMSLGEILLLKGVRREKVAEAMRESLKLLSAEDAKGVEEEVSAIMSTEIPRIGSAMMDYLLYGGMPEVVSKGLRNEEAKKVLKSYFYIAVFKDIVRLLEGAGERLKALGKVESMTRVLLWQSPKVVSAHSVARDIGLSLSTTESYLALLFATHLIQRAKNFAPSPTVEERKRKFKVFACDTGIRNAMVWETFRRRRPEEEGLLLENLVLSHAKRLIRRSDPDGVPRFWRYKNDEVDVIMRYGGELTAIEVKRKAKSLRKFARMYGAKRALQLSLYEDERAVQAWVFLLADPWYALLL